MQNQVAPALVAAGESNLHGRQSRPFGRHDQNPHPGHDAPQGGPELKELNLLMLVLCLIVMDEPK